MSKLLEAEAQRAIPFRTLTKGNRLPRILTVTHYYSGKGGGIELVAHTLARRFAAACDVKWAAIDTGDGLPKDVAIQPLHGIDLVGRLLNVPFPILSPLSLGHLRDAVEWADIVNVHDGLHTTSQAAFFFARLLRKPVVVTQHVGDVPYRSRLLRLALRIGNQLLCRTLLKSATEVVFISETTRQFFQKHLSGKSTQMIYNGVDRKVFHDRGPMERSATRIRLGLDNEEKVALFVGRFVEKKGLHELRALVARRPDVTWVFIGRGPLDPTKWQAPNVRVYGQMSASKLAEWYRAADLLVLPSVGEGFPLVIQEALACGLPCLVAEEARTACPEATPLLLSAGPHAEKLNIAFAAAVKGLDYCHTQRQERATRAQSLWDWDRCASAYLNIFSLHFQD
jgi:phosphatidylinositol alpha-1,6-mannosyltransferase